MIFLRFILFPFVPLYGWIISIRNYFFNAGIFKSHKVDAKIISIGNIVIGGSGKTPTVMYIINLIKNAGIKVGVLSRGYGRKSKGYQLVSDGKEIFCDVVNCGDELILTVTECRVPAAACERRVEGAKKLLMQTDVDSIILDDAFQHRWIKRDLDILIFDQYFLSKPGGIDQNLIPTGLMRESFTSVKRADLIIINRKFSDYMPIPSVLLPYFEGKKIFNGYYRTAGIIDVKNNKFYSVEEFRNQKSLVVSGIARPASFLNVLRQYNINVDNQLLFKDHKHYTEKEVQRIRKKYYASNSNSVITTSKDAVKLNQYDRQLDDIDIYYLKIELEIDNKEEFENLIIEKLK
jgi:tetraacyldisaccharide 4'-kinase